MRIAYKQIMSIRRLLLLVALFACGGSAVVVAVFFLRQPPRVVSIEPADRASDVLPDASVTIKFSAPMDREATQAAVRLVPRVNGSWNWQDDQTLTFIPRTTLPISRTLALEISTDARSRVQSALAQDVRTRFSTVAYPFVVSSAPALDAQFVHIPDQITLTFNRAMNADAVRANLQIEPAPANQTLTIQDTNITVRGFFQPRTRYQISLAAGATDTAYQLPLERDLTFAFNVTEQYPNFSILNPQRVLQFRAQTAPVIPAQFTNVSRLDVAVYPLSETEFTANVNAPYETWFAFQPDAAPIQKKSLPTNVKPDAYAQLEISLAPLRAGYYFIEITSPEGVSDKQLVRVE